MYLGYENKQELVAIGVGFISLTMSYLFLRYRDNKLKDKEGMEIVISHIIS